MLGYWPDDRFHRNAYKAWGGHPSPFGREVTLGHVLSNLPWKHFESSMPEGYKYYRVKGKLPQHARAEFRALPAAITEPTFVEGWFFTTSEKEYNRSAIKAALSFNPILVQYLDQQYQHLFAGVTAVSIHMRLGYHGEEDPNALASRPSPTMDYYIHALTKILGDLPPPVRYLVFADDMPRAQFLLDAAPELADLDIVMMPVNMISGLYLMAKCQHHVLATSSLSFWGAYLADKPGKVIYHSSFVQVHGSLVLPGTQLEEGERWIPVSNWTAAMSSAPEVKAAEDTMELRIAAAAARRRRVHRLRSAMIPRAG
jgi:hypothetical protein